MNIPMDRKKYAQMAVALEACKLLHQRGELNDNLLPVGKDTIAKLLTQLDDDPDEWVPNLRIKVGSAKRKQLYDKRVWIR
jgi:endoribonuclease Dicer